MPAIKTKTRPASTPVQKAALPFVYLNVATTADGKIAPTHDKYVQFSSNEDQQLLMQLRTRADAVMCGAKTVDSYPIDLGPGGKKYRDMRLKNGLSEYNLRVVVSGSGSINPDSLLFKRTFSPVIVLTTKRAPEKKLQVLRSRGAHVKVCGEASVDFVEACRWLRGEWKVKRLLCEGGGEVNAALFHAGLVDELYLTIAPVIIGGRNAPTLADGAGVGTLAEATRLKLKSRKQVGDELFLVYRVEKKRSET